MTHKHHCSGSCSHHCSITIGSFIDWCGGVSEISEIQRRKHIGFVWNDSRKVMPGDIFVAVKTDHDDGHRYVSAAFKAGAAAVIVSKRSDISCSASESRKIIRVPNPLKAVQKAAARYRKEMGILMIGVTGSSGKTTTRTFISSVLTQGITIGETFSNWNNHIGVPLSILRFYGNEWAGVIEMGANHVGEIHELTRIVKPDIAVITNIGYGHVGLFGSIANTASAKFEIADGLTRGGFLLLNGDDPRLVKGAAKRDIQVVYYGLSSRCEIRPENLRVDARRGISFSLDGVQFKLSMPGRHFVYSALPAIFLGRRCGIPDKVIAEVLSEQKPLSMRGTVESKKGVNFIVDCYNANPSSMKSSIAYLSDISKPSRRAAIVGDMLELGKFSRKLHQDLGKDLARSGVKKIIAVGEFASEIAGAAVKEGMSPKKIFTAENAEDAIGLAKKVISAGETVLLKGSRGIHLETVYEKF